MNIHPKCSVVREHGFTLIEMLVYMAVFVVVVGCATGTFYDCWDNTKALRRNADDIARALDIGERWRADVRGATGAVQLTVTNGAEQFRVPALAGEVTYTFANGEIRRQAGSTAPNTLWLSNVKSSQMESDARGRVAAWRWELELQSARREARLRPLFTFECPAGAATTQ
ncbi:MAG TPA: prepilin-type N-terminal cleavage/methylation domain-containing protein [Candidatus Saccharimonadales bacterium]|jgi:prepilin-type N-terminal cleavage/methylation domain-containing protein|nr:prepilin-type N-terminal cleavage/methylation domain-containing protein [Candidatus Saccharimonadales bacterium]